MRLLTQVSAVALSAAGIASTAGAATIASPYNTLSGAAPIVIAHRGAPAYLPENTIGGNELSARMGSDYVETDVMMTSDGVLITMHDATLDRTTDVEDIFEARNGGYAVEDFTYEEISRLTVQPTGSGSTSYPGFEPTGTDPYRVSTFADMLDALTAYNEANGTTVGILTEGKYSDNPETSRAVIETLIEKGYDTPEESMVQSFDFANVADYADLLAEKGVEMGVAQLGSGQIIDGAWYVGSTNDSLGSFDLLAGYTDTVALYFESITAELIAAAHGDGLNVFAWTFRPEDQAMAFDSTEPFLDWGLDGFITDNPDYLRTAVDAYGAQPVPSPVPLPATLPFLALGMASLGGLGRLRRRR